VAGGWPRAEGAPCGGGYPLMEEAVPRVAGAGPDG
jgi:hypothetical protein